MKIFKIAALALVLIAVVIALIGCSNPPAAPVEPNIPEEPQTQENGQDVSALDEEDFFHPWTNYQVIVNGQPVMGGFYLIPPGEELPTHVTLLPVLAALEAGVNASYEPSGMVTVEGRKGEITFNTGSEDFTVNGETITLPYASFVNDGTIYVPLLFFREVFGVGSAFFEGGYIFIDDEEAPDMR